jgi:threonine/homoserine/homoserine lactone efflux protein
MLRYLIIGITYAFAAAAQPGSFQTYIISQSLSRGWRRTLPAAFAPLISDVPTVLIVLLVLTRLPGWLLQVLQLVGGVFLLYLAANAYKSWRDFENKGPAPEQSSQQTVLKAVTVNLLNPNPYLAWSLVLGPLLLKGWQAAPINGIALLVGFYSVMIICQGGIIILFGAARTLGPKVNRMMLGISAIALGCFGIYELWTGFSILYAK